MFLKIHTTKGSQIVTLCDEDLIGKKFEEGKLQLNVTERFYKGDKLSEEEIKKILKNSNNINIVGEKSIKLALDLNMISESNIVIIEGIPHAQSVF